MNERSYGDMRNADSNDTGGSGTVVPAGIYPIYLAEHKFRPTKPGTPQEGEQLVLVLQIAEGPHADAKIYEGFNVRNQNAQTVQISLNKLKGLTEATDQNGDTDLTDTVIRNWYQTLVYVEFKVNPARGQYGESNGVVKFIHPNMVDAYRSQVSHTAPVHAPPVASAANAPAPAPQQAQMALPNAQPDDSVPWAQEQQAAAPSAPPAGAPPAPMAPSAPSAPPIA